MEVGIKKVELPFNTNFTYFTPSSVNNSFHNLINSFHVISLKSWEKFKKLFKSPSPETMKLEELLNADSINWTIHKDFLADCLAALHPYSYQGYLLKLILKKCKEEGELLNEIADAACDKIYAGAFDFDRILNFFSDIELHAITGNVEKEIEELRECLPDPVLPREGSKSFLLFRVILAVGRVFANFMDTVLKAFNLVEVGRPPETMWDFSAMLNIYLRIFSIPFSLFLMVGTIVSIPYQIFLITGGLILASLLLICVYLKFRPCPNNLPRARNLTEEALAGHFEPVVGREKEMNQIVSYLGKKENKVFVNLMLIGEPGVGKTELVKGVAHKCKEKKIFEYNTLALLKSPYKSFQEIMDLILLDINGYENELVFFFDEIGEAVKKEPAILGYLKPLLGPYGIQVIAAATNEEYTQYIKTNEAFNSRFKIINLNPALEEETLDILDERIENKGSGIYFEKDAAEIIYNKTKEMLQPRGAVNLLNLAINHVSAFDSDDFSEDLIASQKEIKRLKRKYEKNHALRNDLAPKIGELSKKIKRFEEMSKAQSAEVKKIRSLIRRRNSLIQERRLLAKQVQENRRLAFIHFLLIPWIESKIKLAMKQVKERVPLTINKDLLQSDGL